MKNVKPAYKPGCPVCRCGICGQKFRSRSTAEGLCTHCWADNEMRPYVSFARMARARRGAA